MYSEYFAVHKEKTSQKKNDHLSLWNKQTAKGKETVEQNSLCNDEEMGRLADRALLLLSFKDTNTQKLPHILKILGINTLKEKQSILMEIYSLIREGIVYIPRGLPQLIENGLDDPEELKNIDLCLLRPYDQLIKEIQDEIARLQSNYEYKGF